MQDYKKPTPLTRRQFVTRSAIGMSAMALGTAITLPGVLQSANPPVRNGKSHMKLSLAAYSFHRLYANRGNAEQIANAKFTLERFIDFCADQDLDGTELTSYYFPKEITQKYLVELKERAFRLGLAISGTAIGNDFCLAEGEKREQQLAMCREWVDHSASLGAPVIRIFAGNVPKGDTEDAARERCVDAINQSVEYAATKGVQLALENHGGITATSDQMLKILQAVKPSPWFGVNFDGGNFKTDDPYIDLTAIAPYATNAQIKVDVYRNGVKELADLARVVQILKAANYRGFLVLEYESDEDPFVAIPRHLKRLRELIS